MTRTERLSLAAAFLLALAGFALAAAGYTVGLLLTVPGWIGVGYVVRR